jgi:predicted enzyme related to lactoylglutathione lyase
MTDPFHVLRAPVTPADPEPGFAARLRARLARALDLPEGVTVSDTGSLPRQHPAPVAAVRRGVRAQARPASQRPGGIGYASLWVPDGDRAAAFYAAVLGWEYAPGSGPAGRRVRNVSPAQGLWGGQPRSTLFCSYLVDDAAAAVEWARAAGGTVGDPVPQPYGLSADGSDNQGIRFALHQPPAGGPAAGPAQAPAARDGDLIYVTMEVPDTGRARDFYGAVLGWQFRPGRVSDGWQVEGTTPMIGLVGGREAAAVPVWRAGDLAAAVARVRAAGGAATEPRPEPYGLITDCTDDQGTRFCLCQFPAG